MNIPCHFRRFDNSHRDMTIPGIIIGIVECQLYQKQMCGGDNENLRYNTRALVMMRSFDIGTIIEVDWPNLKVDYEYVKNCSLY